MGGVVSTILQLTLLTIHILLVSLHIQTINFHILQTNTFQGALASPKQSCDEFIGLNHRILWRSFSWLTLSYVMTIEMNSKMDHLQIKQKSNPSYKYCIFLC